MEPKIIRVSDYTDKTIQCVDCGVTFTWSAPEQAFYASKGFTPNQNAARIVENSAA